MTDRELMQQALEALTTYDGTNGESKRKRVLTTLRERLAQPEQEPVACRYCHYSHTLGAVYFDQNCAGCVKRMTTPPQRGWQGLTDDDIAQAMYRADAIITGSMQFKFAREIEAKLKEKNND